MQPTKKVMAIDFSCFIVVEDDVSLEEVEEGLDQLIPTIPGVKAYEPTHMLVQSAGDVAYCCPTCNSPLVQEVQVRGTYVLPVGVGSGVVTEGDYHGDKEVAYVCTEDRNHEIPQELLALLSKASDIEDSAFE